MHSGLPGCLKFAQVTSESILNKRGGARTHPELNCTWLMVLGLRLMTFHKNTRGPDPNGTLHVQFRSSSGLTPAAVCLCPSSPRGRRVSHTSFYFIWTPAFVATTHPWRSLDSRLLPKSGSGLRGWTQGFRVPLGTGSSTDKNAYW